ncbi:7254_t:CDS:2 [Ambispora gerdemannii]|uniref:7254_t:CDS:1 n=1 Tax=Ambispora gerdemannii TaxID=144530 RepID=A0A9N9D958_9GLOM|nr:7254_t:CDS:2 [Ambispora gerdemannii]
MKKLLSYKTKIPSTWTEDYDKYLENSLNQTGRNFKKAIQEIKNDENLFRLYTEKILMEFSQQHVREILGYNDDDNCHEVFHETISDQIDQSRRQGRSERQGDNEQNSLAVLPWDEIAKCIKTRDATECFNRSVKFTFTVYIISSRYITIRKRFITQRLRQSRSGSRSHLRNKEKKEKSFDLVPLHLNQKVLVKSGLVGPDTCHRIWLSNGEIQRESLPWGDGLNEEA